jgi:hypothetical protein
MLIGDILALVLSDALQLRIQIFRTKKPQVIILNEAELTWPVVELVKGIN